MADKSAIEWTDATWSPTVGCSIVSPGCTNCYAMRLAARLEKMGSAKYAGLTQPSKAGAVWNGVVRLDETALALPLRWRRPRRIFVNSMSDLFHENLPDAAIDRVFAVMALAPQHIFQVLTKRAERMRDYAALLDNEPVRDTVRRIVAAWPGKQPVPHEIIFPLPNVWLGVSVEDQARADERIPHLLATPAAVRFLSCEPLLAALNIERWTDRTIDGRFHAEPIIDWVIAGSESGPRARSCDLDWVRSLRDQCSVAGVAFFWKQDAINGRKIPVPEIDGRRHDAFPEPR